MWWDSWLEVNTRRSPEPKPLLLHSSLGPSIYAASRWCDRKREREASSTAVVVLRRNPAAVIFDNAPADRETHSHPVDLRRKERSENRPQSIDGNSRPMIADSNGYAFWF